MNTLKNILAPSSLNVQDTPAKMEVHELFKHRYTMCESILLEYIDYAQMVENKTHKEVLAEVTKIADELTAKYSLGSAFLDDLSDYMLQRFNRTANDSFQAIQDGSGLNEDIFNTLMKSFRKDGIAESFSPRFRTVFR